MVKPFFLIAAFVAMFSLVSCGTDDGVEKTKVANHTNLFFHSN